MAELSPRELSPRVNPNYNGPLPSVTLSESRASSDVLDVLSALRKTLSEDTNPPAQVIHAAAEFARILTGANGVALALRIKGRIVCRARSGDIAPELGVPLSADSGISGECLRTAAVLLCNDAATDPRVDPEACRALGIRSMVAVPLRGPTGIVGILEAFSTGTNAFGPDAIDALRGLAEIAEAGYERECTPPPAPRRPTPTEAVRMALSAAPTVSGQSFPGEEKKSFLGRHYRIVGIATIALLLTFLVAWYSWRGSALELAAGEPVARTSNPPGEASPTPQRTTPKPPPGISRAHAAPSRAGGVLRNAASIENADDDLRAVDAPRNVPADTQSEETNRTTQSPANEPPPTIEVVALDNPSGLPGLTSAPAPLPTLAPRVSQGVTEATLIHKVDPTYPPQARILRLDGSVTLDATIGEDGTVHGIKVVSGPPVLATAATEAVRKWRYSPPLLNGTPIETHRLVTIVFKLPGEKF